MTKDELINKIQEKCERDSLNLWFFKWKSRFWLTKTEPYFVVQTVEQLPEEYIPLQLLKPSIVLTFEGAYVDGKLYPWSTILVSAILDDRAKGLYLILGLENGNLVECIITNRYDEIVRELGHMVEMYKRKAKKN